MREDYELIEHTADIGVRVRGADLKGLFIKAAQAMFDIIAELPVQTKKQKLKKQILIKQKADNIDELFVNWLNELLSLSSAKEIIFSDFKIKKINEEEIEAQVSGAGVADYKVNTEIKAATYHQLKVQKTKSGWQAEVIFDV